MNGQTIEALAKSSAKNRKVFVTNRNYGESQMQATLFDLIRTRAKTDVKWDVIYSIPNGGLRDRGTAKKMKSEGVRAGVWDICVPVQTADFVSLRIEMKFDKNKLTPSQIDFKNKIESANAGFKPTKWVVCYSYMSAYEEIENYLKG